eukprot:TRINITY_DN1593_c0_g1_i2.p1 TRINITY_DN1593_c0_g1~~TRINITY_DN1593_c0_g1_i2.p1  ORF type:complete len:242 (-),score=6.08 TRINITY_DN1593_c0_g1_i2:130-855(-)
MYLPKAVIHLWLVACASAECIYVIGEDAFDLTGLRNNYADYVIRDYSLNVCGPLVDSQSCGQGYMGCQTYSKSGLGTPSSATASSIDINSVKGFTLSLNNGLSGRSMEINFVCNQYQLPGVPVFVAETNLHYNFQWQTVYGCPVVYPPSAQPPSGIFETDVEGLSGGSIFLIILLVFSVVYFFGGMVYLKFRRHEAGLDIIPNRVLWINFFGLVKDGAVYSFEKVRERINHARTGGSYSSL